MRRPILPAATLLLLLLIPTVAMSAPLPASPEEHECPEGAEKEREETRRGAVVRCVRPDGVPVGVQAAWYPDGTLREIRSFLGHESWSNQHGTHVYWQPDGSKATQSQWDDGAPVGEHISWPTDGPPVTYLYEQGVPLDIYTGRTRPHFDCPDGLAPRVRILRQSSGSSSSLTPPPRPAIELWCEHPREPARFPASSESVRPMRVECQMTSEGVLAWIGSTRPTAYGDRLPPPEGFDPRDPDALRALCARPDFWRERRREGPYVSRGSNGAPLEEGPYVRGQRHGVFRVHGLACVRWRTDQRLGRAPCPAGPPYEPDPWIATAWEELDRARARLGWPPLEGGPPEEPELRIWQFPRPPGYSVGTLYPQPPRVLRLRRSDAGETGEVVTWKAPPELMDLCDNRDGDEEDVCRFTDPTPWAWKDVFHELRLLDAWTLPPATSIRIPAVARDPGERRSGIFVEARSDDGRVSRDWYGPVRAEPFEGTHQTRGIADLVDRLWRGVLENAGTP